MPWHSPVSAQETNEDGRFYLGFAGSAVFPYNPKVQSGSIVPLVDPRNYSLKAGAGFTAAFGYAFKEGFSTEIEWGYQKVSGGDVVKTLENVFSGIDGDVFSGFEGFPLAPITVTRTSEIGGEIKTQSLMGNVYYCYPKWRVSSTTSSLPLSLDSCVCIWATRLTVSNARYFFNSFTRTISEAGIGT